MLLGEHLFTYYQVPKLRIFFSSRMASTLKTLTDVELKEIVEDLTFLESDE